MMRPPHIQHMNQMPPQTATHHMSNMTQHQQPHMNLTTGQQPHNHMMHGHQNYHQNRSSNQHNHHSQQRMSYGQNRPNYHNGSHNMHNNHGPNNVVNIPSTVSQSQQQPTNISSKIDTNIGVQSQSNSQTRYKTMDSSNLGNQQQQQQPQQHKQPHASQKPSNSDNVLNLDIMEMNHGCVDDQSGLNVIATSTTSSKTKTPMCLINELARANQLKHQYRVADERGPSHDKMYTVVLELGDERYSAQSKTIKGAQQAAAASALEKTNYKQPTSRTPRGVLSRHPREKYGPVNTITPTVQLNALAMKRGIPTNYSYTYPKSHNEQTLNLARNARIKGNKMRNFRDKFPNQRLPQFVHRTTEDDPYRVTVVIGDKQFSGTGLTLQMAKHDAASKALVELQEEPSKPTQSTASNSFESSDDKVVHGMMPGDVNVDRIKSAISVVQEIAQKRDLPIRFVVENETGPAHMKHFVIKCSVGEIETTGEGNSKKVAKKHAAENMLNELKKLPPIRNANETQANGRRKNFIGKRNVPNSRQQVQQINGSRRKGSATVVVVKEANNTNALNAETSATTATATTTTTTTSIPITNTATSATDETELGNPISMLFRIQQASKQPEPLYNVVEERGHGRRKEFVMEVKCSNLSARGIGASKKNAKREAANNILIQMGYSESGNSDTAANQNASNNNNISEKSRKVTFSESRLYSDNGQSIGGAAGRQLVPGLLLVKSPENNKKYRLKSDAKTANQSGINYTTTATIAKELLDAGTSPTAEAIMNQASPVKKAAPTEEIRPASTEVSPSKIEPNNNNIGETKSTTQSHGGVRATDQLLYLAQLLKFEVQFDDFPRGNHKDYLTLASLNTDPPQMFHGSGSSLEASKNEAALAALKALSELGLDNVNKPRDQPTKSILSNGKSN